MKFRPLHDRVVIKRIEAEEKSSGGIIIPDTAKEKPQEGEVIAVGPQSGTSSDKRFRKSVRDGTSKPSPLGFLQMPPVILSRQPTNL